MRDLEGSAAPQSMTFFNICFFLDITLSGTFREMTSQLHNKTDYYMTGFVRS